MHICNIYCSENEHIDIIYVIQKDNSRDIKQDCITSLEAYSKNIKILHLKEIYEFSKEEAKNDLAIGSVNSITFKVVSYILKSDDEIRAFRATFIYK